MFIILQLLNSGDIHLEWIYIFMVLFSTFGSNIGNKFIISVSSSDCSFMWGSLLYITELNVWMCFTQAKKIYTFKDVLLSFGKFWWALSLRSGIYEYYDWKLKFLLWRIIFYLLDLDGLQSISMVRVSAGVNKLLGGQGSGVKGDSSWTVMADMCLHRCMELKRTVSQDWGT